MFLICFFISVEVNFFYYAFMCELSGKTVPEMTYIVSGGTLNPTHSLTIYMSTCCRPRRFFNAQNLL